MLWAYIYALGAVPGAVPIAQGTYGQDPANSLHVTIAGAGLAQGLWWELITNSRWAPRCRMRMRALTASPFLASS
jgi:hypothetical protein